MKYPSFRFLLALTLAASFVAGCGDKKGTGPSRGPETGPVRDGESAALATLEGHPDAETVKNALQRLDGLEDAGSRPTWDDSDRAELVTLCRLTDAEATDLGQRTFSPGDAAYLELCLTIRSGLRALNLDRRPPAERGALAFEWVCRTAYVDTRVPAPTPPGITLQAGFGIALSRAYAVLAAWQQAGLDGCLVGPAALKDTTAIARNASLQQAPVRACGLRVGPDIFLYDAAGGKAIPAADGKGVLTLAAARANPAAAKGLADEAEVKSWQPFLAPPLNSLTRRMEWLEGLNPGAMNANVFTDIRAEAARYKEAGESPAVWNPTGDALSPVRIVNRFSVEEAPPDGVGPVKTARERLREDLVPLDLLPQNKIVRNAHGLVQEVFKSWYNRFWFNPGSPRDLYVRGDLPNALSALKEIGSEVNTIKSRVDQDRTLRADFIAYFDKLFELSADQERARGDAEAFAVAAKRFRAFRSEPKNVDIERAYTLGTAARPMIAEVLFLTAACVHERAERAQLEGGAEAASGWRNAVECWDRYLSEAAVTRKAFPGREPHARAMRARCQSFLPK